MVGIKRKSKLVLTNGDGLEYKDEVVFSLYKYIFDTLDEKLLFTMNERVRKAIALTYTLIHNEFKG